MPTQHLNYTQNTNIMLICKRFTQFHRCQRVHRTCWAEMEMRYERKNRHNKWFNWTNEKSRMNWVRFYTYCHEMDGMPNNNMIIQYWQTRNFFVHPLGRAVAFDIILTIIMMMLNRYIKHWMNHFYGIVFGRSLMWLFCYFQLFSNVITCPNKRWMTLLPNSG